MTCRVAVIGAGYFGQFHLDAWTRMEGADLVAVVEPDAAKARAVAASMGARVFAEPDAMLEAARPDLVDITAPPPAHLDLIERLAPRVGRIICQKPFCGGGPDAARAVAIAAASGARLAVHENFRFQPWYREIARLVSDGAVGAPYHVSFALRPGDGQGPEAYLARQPYFQTMPRFLVHETAVHWIDTFRFLMGEVTGVFARLIRRNPAIRGEDGGVLVFDFAGGTTGIFDGNRLADHAAENPRLTMGEMILDGSDGGLRLDGSGGIWRRARGQTAWTAHDYAWENRAFGGDCVYLTNRAVLQAWDADRDAETEAAAYLRNIDIVDAVYRSHEEGRWIAV